MKAILLLRYWYWEVRWFRAWFYAMGYRGEFPSRANMQLDLIARVRTLARKDAGLPLC